MSTDTTKYFHDVIVDITTLVHYIDIQEKYMKITSRFTLAIQTLLVIACFSEKTKVTSTFLSNSTNSNPVIIRRILGQLKKAGLVEIKAGVGGSYIKKPLDEITLFDVFNAVNAADYEIFSFHDNPECNCPVGKNIHTILDSHLLQIQEVMNHQMKSTSLATLLEETKPYIK